jgi:hypothetical protein
MIFYTAPFDWLHGKVRLAPKTSALLNTLNVSHGHPGQSVCPAYAAIIYLQAFKSTTMTQDNQLTPSLSDSFPI